jgi:Ca2+-binding EF-hand superfamily protein
MSTAASAFAGLGERVPDPIDMQRAMCPRSIPAGAPIISPRGPKVAVKAGGSPRRMRYSFLKGQNTHFLSSDTMNDIAASHMRKATGGPAVVEEEEPKPAADGDEAADGAASPRRRTDTRDEYSFSRPWKQVNLDLSPASVKASASAFRVTEAKRDLRTVFGRIDMTNDGTLDAEEVEALLKGLGYDPEPGEVEDMIWEVDDDCDGVIKWQEFKSLYDRVRKDEHGKEPRRMYTIIEFCLFDLDESGCVGLAEVMELFYRRYGTIANLEKTDKTGFITFKQFVKRDTAFYSLSRQIEDSAKAVKANQRREMMELLSEPGMAEKPKMPGSRKKPSAMTPRAMGGVPAASVQTRTGLRDIKPGTTTGHIRSQSGRLPRHEEKKRRQAAQQKRDLAMAKKKEAEDAQKPDWKAVSRDELSKQAREEAERALKVESELARERARKAADMPKVLGADEIKEMKKPGVRGSDGKLVVPTYPEVHAVIERNGTSDPDTLLFKEPMSWSEGRKQIEEQVSKDENRPPSRIMYGHLGLKQPSSDMATL